MNTGLLPPFVPARRAQGSDRVGPPRGKTREPVGKECGVLAGHRACVAACARISRLLGRGMNLLGDRSGKLQAEFACARHEPLGRRVGSDDARVVDVRRILGQFSALRLAQVAEQDRPVGVASRRARARPVEAPAHETGRLFRDDAVEDRKQHVVPDLVGLQRCAVMGNEFCRFHGHQYQSCLDARPAEITRACAHPDGEVGD
jgi:hypothetical protein